jgi:hypothetical protein
VINRVIDHIISKNGKNNKWLSEFIHKVPGAKEKFICYAKRTDDVQLMDRLHEMIEEPISYAAVKMNLKRANLAISAKAKEDEL